MDQTVNLTVNGKRVSLTVDARTLLVQLIREQLKLTGTHVGCDTAQCGACTVHLNGRAVKACSMLAVQAEGAEITTIEGLSADGELTDVQRAFVDCGAVQCGFCTPGLVVAVEHLLAENPSPGELEMKEALSGNICRCTGYGRIFAAVESVVALRSAR